ncbi:alpha-galactosidase [Niabella sp. 22666]|uniref:alpha-galactosidase n=1 Tax=Niabella sp. 22666 TaxID=3453954 RepID=UPI003F84F5E4
MRFFLKIIGLVLVPFAASSQNGYYSRLEKDTLVIGNGLVERKFTWNKGNLITYSLTNKSNKHTWLNQSQSPDFSVSGSQVPARNSSFTYTEVAENSIRTGYLEATVGFTVGTLEVKRVFRIYKDCPVIACDTYLRGKMNQTSDRSATSQGDQKNIEFAADMQSRPVSGILDQLKPGGFHWQTRVVEFYDITDWNNNLVFETNIIPYRKNSYRGNLLFAQDMEADAGFFLLKEAPSSTTQLAYPGNDFTTEFGHFMVTGPGLTPKDIKEDEWRKAYSVVTGVYNGGELNRLTALRSYQKNMRKLLPGRDEMVMMNTWGDRSQDSRVNEQFSLLEVERAAQLGITHFQIDDGWQQGKSPNSAVAKGSFENIWNNPDYWTPDPVKYPNGLGPVVEKGKKLGVEICLWFNPSVQNNYADWEKDAQALIKLYQSYGIRTFKIDGLAIPTKQAEINLRKLFDRVLDVSNNNVVFNLDATAGRRSGYHSFNEYGNIFLENRYTDWQNYYPYWTLRNLWLLSKYVPAEKLQIEFLNKWRNADKYGKDVFAPAHYSFEYLFAVTMAAQPLAWFEGTGLPAEALDLAKVIKAYKNMQHDFHKGTILPIGDEPSGRSWTGFQSIHKGYGYLLVFRERNPQQHATIKTWLPENTKLICTKILGSGLNINQVTGPGGTLKLQLQKENDYVLYKYQLAGSGHSK